MSRRRPRLAPDLGLVDWLSRLAPDLRDEAVRSFGEEDAETLDRAWSEWAHEGQGAPDGDWSTWVLMAGRGFGKTLAGAQWITAAIAAHDRVAAGDLSIALVGATLDDARRVMVDGRSGLLTVAAPWVRDWSPSLRRLRFTTGAEATLFSGASPDLLRGPEHHLAWCDELGKWEKAQDCWNMLQLGLRLGERPRALITTTPGRGALLREIMAEPGTVKTRGRSGANPHTSATWRARMEATYAGTRLGRQELDGELLPEAGALWTPELIEACRNPCPPRAPLGEGDRSPQASGGGGGNEATGSERFTRTLIAVDPPVGDGTCGIVAVARIGEGQAAVAHVLADHSVTARSPEGWARAVAAAAAAHGTDEVVAEGNQGGTMVKAILHTAAPHLRVRMVNASKSKSARAEPVAHLREKRYSHPHSKGPLFTRIRHQARCSADWPAPSASLPVRLLRKSLWAHARRTGQPNAAITVSIGRNRERLSAGNSMNSAQAK